MIKKIKFFFQTIHGTNRYKNSVFEGVREGYSVFEGIREGYSQRFDYEKINKYLPYSVTTSRGNYHENLTWAIDNSKYGWFDLRSYTSAFDENNYYTFYFSDPNDAALFKLFSS